MICEPVRQKVNGKHSKVHNFLGKLNLHRNSVNTSDDMFHGIKKLQEKPLWHSALSHCLGNPSRGRAPCCSTVTPASPAAAAHAFGGAASTAQRLGSCYSGDVAADLSPPALTWPTCSSSEHLGSGHVNRRHLSVSLPSKHLNFILKHTLP